MFDHRLRLFAILALGGLLVGCGSGATSTSNTPTSVSKTAIQAPTISGNNPFHGKTINLESEGSPGTSADMMDRLIAPYLAKYLHATVNVVDMPGGGGLTEWNNIS